MAAYGRAAQRCRRTIGTQRRLRMRYGMASMLCKPSPGPFRAGSIASCRAGLAATVEGRLRTRCSRRCVAIGRWGLAAAVDALHHRRRDVGEFWARRVLLSCLSSAWAPRSGLWRGVGICSVCRMNPVGADRLRAQRGLTRREGSLKESTAAPSWQHSQKCLLAAPMLKTGTTRSA